MHKLATLTLAAALATSGAAMAQTAWYVDDNAPLGGDGMSWSSAFTYLQDALAAANPGDGIRVGAGMYKPDQDEGGHVTPADRTETFQLISAVELRGGYAGFGAPTPDERNIVLYETTLSGDLLGNDLPGFVNNSENSYHIVTSGAIDYTAVLEGFTVTGGNANGSSLDTTGGGILVLGGSPGLINCLIRDNWAYDGAGMMNWDGSSPTLVNCAFLGNVVGPQGNNPYGAGVYVFNSSPTVSNCTFSGNSAVAGAGGGMFVDGASSPTVTNCVLWGNSDGGGMDEFAQIHVAAGTPVVTYSCIQGCTTFCADPGNRNISDDPLLTADGHLSPGSPCIDAGDTTVLPAGLYVDLDSKPRVLDDACTDDTGMPASFVPVTVDMGAYEYHLPGDLDVDGDVDLSDLAELLAHYGISCY